MVTSVALYSSSPPSALFSSQRNSNSNSISSNLESELVRTSSLGHNPSLTVRGGLSALFANNSSKISSLYVPSHDSHENGCCAVLSTDSNSFTYRDSELSINSSCNIPISMRSKDRSPVSVLFGQSSSKNSSPAVSISAWDSFSNSNTVSQSESHLPPHSRRSSLSNESRIPLSRSIGFHLSDMDKGNSTEFNHNGSQATPSSQPTFTNLRTPSADFSDIINSFENSLKRNLSRESIPEPWHDSTTVETATKFPRSFKKSTAEMIEKRDSVLSMVESAVGLSSPLNSKSSFTLHQQLDYLEDIDLLSEAQERHSIFFDPLVKKAFFAACNAHRGQIRKNGDPTVKHCIETGIILALCGAEKSVIAAGLLHDTLDDSNITASQLELEFGSEIRNLVSEVSKLSEFSQMIRDNSVGFSETEADRLRTMFLAMTDVRVVLIKLADRLHNLRTLHALSPIKQQRIAKESLEIFAPLANRLGIWKWKAEIEDICFEYLHPEDHAELAARLEEESRSEAVLAAIKRLDCELRMNGVQFDDLSGRPKNLYSVYQKMNKKGKKLEEIFDLRAIRIIVADEESCYSALEIVHELWENASEKHLKDYVKNPKSNGYQSLHTVVRGEGGQSMEVQIRTMEMHHQAEFGIAAHWRYKEGSSNYSAAVLQKVEFARWMLTWHSEISDSKLRVASPNNLIRPPCPFPSHSPDCKFSNCHSCNFEHVEDENDPVVVIMLENDNMTVKELDGGMTARDLINQSQRSRRLSNGSTLPMMCSVKAMINHEIVHDLERKIRMGDLVEMIEECHPLPLHAPSPHDYPFSSLDDKWSKQVQDWFHGGFRSPSKSIVEPFESSANFSEEKAIAVLS